MASRVPFLVLYDYGQGGIWAIVRAESKGLICERFPELVVYDDPPTWMDDQILRRLHEKPIDVDRPSGLLADILKRRS